MKDNNTNILDKLMKSPRVKNLGLRKETIEEILKIYGDLAVETLLDNGCLRLDSGVSIEIVQLTGRVHVLRGNTYKSNRKYKLKLTMESDFYDRLESYYDKLEEDIS